MNEATREKLMGVSVATLATALYKRGLRSQVIQGVHPVKAKGRNRPHVVPCTLLPYDGAFELGHDLAGSAKTVKLNHPHCAKFCVLGGASCSVK